MRACLTNPRQALVVLLWACFAAPALAGDAAPAAPEPPVCQGRDLSAADALDADALARARARRADPLDNDQGLLWRIEKPNGTASYLFGTIHSTDERAVALARAAAQYIRGAKVVATELGGPFDKAALAELGATALVKALDKQGDTLASIGPPDDLARVEKYLAARGVSAEFAHHVRIWFLAALTAAPPCELRRQQLDLPIVDVVIAQTGKDLGVKVVGLETMDEQMDILSSIEPSLAATVLVSAARRPDFYSDVYATLLDLYALKRPGEILPVADASEILNPGESRAEDAFTAHLLGARNEIMTARMAPLLDDGPAFVAVGALHLIGKDGLIELLRARGFRVTNVW